MQRGRAPSLSLDDRPTAVVCDNDVIAYGVLLGAERSGFAVPRDLSVIGFRISTGAGICGPSDHHRVPTGETWQRAGEYLVRRLAGEQTHHASRESTTRSSFASRRPTSETTRTIAMTSTPSRWLGAFMPL